MPADQNNSYKDDFRSPAEKFFGTCKLEPVIQSDNSNNDNTKSKIVVAPIVLEGDDFDDDDHPAYDGTVYATTSFYLDASGRSKMSLPLKFTFDSQEALDHFLACDVIHPVPYNIVKKGDDKDNDDGNDGEGKEEEGGDSNSTNNNNDSPFKAALGFEVTTVAVASADTLIDFESSTRSMKSVYSSHSQSQHGNGGMPLLQQHRAIVEGITVVSSRIEGTSVYFDTQVIVRAAQHDSLMIKTRLHVVAVLSEQPRNPPTQESRMSYEGFPDFTLQTTLTASKVKHTRLEAFLLEVTLTDALAIDVTSVTGPTTGRTFVSLVLRHPNTHQEPVTVTNIAMHPGHSRLELPAPPGSPSHNNKNNSNNIPATQSVVVDMSQCVQWGYAPQTQPKLPMILHPRGAYATILTVDAMEHMRSRTFKSPVSVTAVVGSPNDNSNTTAVVVAAEPKEGEEATPPPPPPTPTTTTPTTIASADAQWTTGRLAQEPSDAFRIDMQLQNKDFYVGEPFTIFLRVKNLSADARDMMLLVAKDSDKQTQSTGTTTTTSSSSATTSALAMPMGNNLNVSSHHGDDGGGGMSRDTSSMYGQPQQRSSVPNTAVVSEVNGYTFGVWGLIADADNPVFRLDRDQDLLAIDAALLLGEIKGHHSVEAQLRFNPLREGTLDVPNMQLFDKRNRKWYYCTHKLNIVARQSESGAAKAVGGK